VRFEGGVAVEIDADEGAENLRARTAEDEGGRRLGEVALVDRDGPDRAARHGLLRHAPGRERRQPHAFGMGFEFACGDEIRARVNQSATHIDFMIGGEDVDVTGLTAAGESVPVLRGGAWQI
jgi:aminopeptidase